MADQLWARIDDYLVDALVPSDSVLDHTLRAGVDAGMPQIQVTPTQGKLLYLLALAVGAKRILEVGTLAGYSAIWMARALPPDGRLVTLEVDSDNARVARSSIRRAGLEDRIDVRLGPAMETLPALQAEGAGPFDFVFVDADKENNPGYVAWALRLSRPGTVIVVDNIVRHGALIDAASEDASVRGVRAMFELIASEPRLEATALQTVGSKGHDGFAILRVKS
jgi:predicted O-methyltransferase YrrM